MNHKGRMSYKDFLFPVNPSKIRIALKRTLAVQQSPYAGSTVADMGAQSRRVSGEGEFFGNDCHEVFGRLQALFHAGGAGILYIPSQKPMYAVLDSLELIGEDIDGTVRYAFHFTESPSPSGDSPTKYCIADGQHSLWDYAYLYEIALPVLLRCNPDVLRPDTRLPHGKKVVLC